MRRFGCGGVGFWPGGAEGEIVSATALNIGESTKNAAALSVPDRRQRPSVPPPRAGIYSKSSSRRRHA